MTIHALTYIHTYIHTYSTCFLLLSEAILAQAILAQVIISLKPAAGDFEREWAPAPYHHDRCPVMADDVSHVLCHGLVARRIAVFESPPTAVMGHAKSSDHEAALHGGVHCLDAIYGCDWTLVRSERVRPDGLTLPAIDVQVGMAAAMWEAGLAADYPAIDDRAALVAAIWEAGLAANNQQQRAGCDEERRSRHGDDDLSDWLAKRFETDARVNFINQVLRMSHLV